MKLKVINSNSKGNCYILEYNNAVLLLECGVKLSEIKKALGFDLSKVDACTMSHEHMDHAKAAKDLHGAGVPILSSFKTKAAVGINPNGWEIGHGQTMRAANWEVSAFNVDHDAAHPLGFVVNYATDADYQHPILFITDTYKLKWNLKHKFKTVIIEANYCELLAEKWRESKGNYFVEGRRLKNHMSFQMAIYILERLDLSECENIVLIHLSDGLTDEQRFETTVSERFGIPCKCAKPELEIELDNPYV